MNRFDGKTVLVVGGAQGMGLASAKRFAAEGARLALFDIEAETVQDAATRLRGDGHLVEALAGDVSVAADVESAVAATVDRFGGIDVLVHAAAIVELKPILDFDERSWRRIVDVNLMGVVHGCLFFGPQLVERGRGHIVNVASAAAYTPSKMLPAYGATKAGVLMLSESLRAELAGTGVGDSAVCPGFIATGIYRAAR